MGVKCMWFARIVKERLQMCLKIFIENMLMSHVEENNHDSWVDVVLEFMS